LRHWRWQSWQRRSAAAGLFSRGRHPTPRARSGRDDLPRRRRRPWFQLDPRRREIPISQVAAALRAAVVAVEDRRFFRHHGIDPVAVARAFAHNLRARRFEQGASTITQQLARTLFLSRERTVGRKAREALLALLLESMLSKERILELYLNRVPLGGVYGVEAFALDIFGKPAADLSLAESALVAGVIRAPTALSPRTHLDAALAAAAPCSRGCAPKGSSPLPRSTPRSARRCASSRNRRLTSRALATPRNS